MLPSGAQEIALRETPRTDSILENFMPTFLTLITETKEGESTIRDSVNRAAKFREEAQSFGVTVKELGWTMGSL